MQDFIFYVATCPNGLDDFEKYKGLKRLPVGVMRIVISADSWDENGKATYHASDLQVSMLKEWMAGQFDMRGYAIRGCPACFLILKGMVISSHETNRFS